MLFPKSSSEWLNVNKLLFVRMHMCMWEGEGGVGREGGRREREKERKQCQGNVFNFKWPLASKCLVDLGNLHQSMFWMWTPQVSPKHNIPKLLRRWHLAYFNWRDSWLICFYIREHRREYFPLAVSSRPFFLTYEEILKELICTI